MSHKEQKKETTAKDALAIITRANVIKDWGDQYRVYTVNSVIFVFVDANKNVTHFSTRILKNGELDKIAVTPQEAENIKSAIDVRFKQLYKNAPVRTR